MSKKLPKPSIALKGLRGREGLTQQELAKKIDVSPATISRMESGQKKVTSDDARKLARALKTKPNMFS